MKEEAIAPDAYDSAYYLDYWGSHVPYEPGEQTWIDFFGNVAERIVAEVRPRRTLDVGCAMGFLVAALRERGVEAHGFDISEYAIGRAEEVQAGLSEHLWQASAVEPIDQRYDLITCFEVVEHMGDHDARIAIKNMAAAGDRILFSSTPSDYGEPTHVNVRPVEYWASLFAEHGMYRDLTVPLDFVAPWAGMFVREDLTPARIVRLYESERELLRSENVDLRTEVQRLFRQVGEMRDGSSTGSQISNDTELRQRLTEAELAVLGQRDRTLAAERELEELKGELARTQAEVHTHLAHAQMLSTLVGDVNEFHFLKHSTPGRALLKGLRTGKKVRRVIK